MFLTMKMKSMFAVPPMLSLALAGMAFAGSYFTFP